LSNDNEEPEIVAIAKKEVVITTEPKTSTDKTKKPASTSNQKMTTQNTDIFKMILTTNGVVDLGD
jgi:hypothetical protein